MKYRKLRIAVVICLGVACVLLIALWVMSTGRSMGNTRNLSIPFHSTFMVTRTSPPYHYCITNQTAWATN
jgi:hypothetical protein